MASEISQRELRNNSGEIMRRVDQGETFIVTRNGVPVAELIPIRRRQFVPAEEAIAMFRGVGRVDYKRLRKDLDRWVSQDPTPRA